MKSIMQIERQWLLLKSIPDKARPKSTEDLWRSVTVEENDISRRTVERDLAYLSTIFPIGQITEGRTNLWFWESGAKIWLPSLTDDEALTMYMAEKNLGKLLPEKSMERLEPYFSAARERLQSSSDGKRSWTNKFRMISSSVARQPASISPRILRSVRTALLKDRKLWITVDDHSKKTLTSFKLLINPLAIVQQDTNFFLVFNEENCKKARNVLLSHVTHVEESASEYGGLPNFDIDRYIRLGSLNLRSDLPIPFGSWIEFCGIFEKQVGESLNESPLSWDHWCGSDEDGRLRIKATMLFTGDFLDWLNGLGASVTVVEPVKLRRYMAEQSSRLAEMYVGESDDEVAQHTVNWYDSWEAFNITCMKCSWIGRAKQFALSSGEFFFGKNGTPQRQFRCPKCSNLLLNICYKSPNLEDVSDSDILYDAILTAKIENHNLTNLIEKDKLISASQLPILREGPDFLSWKLTLHPDGRASFTIWHGIKFLWAQPAQWNGHKEFLRIARLLKSHFGDLIRDLRPTPEACIFLLGDQVEEARHNLTLARAICELNSE